MLQAISDGILNGLGWLIMRFCHFYMAWFEWSQTLPTVFEVISLFLCVGSFVLIVRAPFTFIKLIGINAARRAAGKSLIKHDLSAHMVGLDEVNEKGRL